MDCQAMQFPPGKTWGLVRHLEVMTNDFSYEYCILPTGVLPYLIGGILINVRILFYAMSERNAVVHAVDIKTVF